MNAKDLDLLTERELEVMHVFWGAGEITAQQARDQLEKRGRQLTYTTVANLCRVLADKGFLERCGISRPFSFKQAKSFQEVSSNLVSDLVSRLFRGSREQLVMQVMQPERLTPKKQRMLKELLQELEQEEGDQS